jgi:hypothetical protein
MTVQSGLLPLPAQLAVAGTVFFTSLSSTILLQVVAHPYVGTLHEIVPSQLRQEPSTTAPQESQLDRKFKATRFSMFGQPKVTEFTLRQAQRDVANPFASFQVKPAGFFYIYGGEIKDTAVRRALTKES